jgi:cellulose synthase/poly-beta-1,6-N-acetylglucosamine synthase-like glycosyltransferase
MLSIIITSFKEVKTLKRAINSFLSQDIKEEYEILVVAPDNETRDFINSEYKNNKRVIYLRDEGKGKPSALNLAFKQARGNFLILTDGDVFVSKSSIFYLLKSFTDSKVGGVTGRVISTNNKDTMFGYWAHLLTDSFHNLRLKQDLKNKNVICSGYLYAVRKSLINTIPQDILADDAFISLTINKKGFKTKYSPKSEVYVKYPSTLPDWIRQKKRTAGRFYQLKKQGLIGSKTISFLEEIISSRTILRSVKCFKHIPWILFLFFMRLYIWARVFLDFRLWNRSFNKIWQRVESTKG